MKSVKQSFAALGLVALAAPMPATAQSHYYGEIITTAATFCPENTLDTDGRVLRIAQYTPLFALLGTQYGGDGKETFALPDLRGRSAIGQGKGPDIEEHKQGSMGGAETVTLANSQVPLRITMTGVAPAPAPTAPGTPLGLGVAPNFVQPVPVRDPYVTLRYCIVVSGVFPSRP